MRALGADGYDSLADDLVSCPESSEPRMWPDRAGVASHVGSARGVQLSRRAPHSQRDADVPKVEFDAFEGARGQGSRDAGREPACDRGRASWSSVRAIRSTTARVSASSSLSAASSSACAVAASGVRTRSLTVVWVSSAMRRSLGSEGDVAPRSQRETVIASTPSSPASCFWVSPAPRLAARRRRPTPSVFPASKLRRLLAHEPEMGGARSHRRSSRTRFPQRSQR